VADKRVHKNRFKDKERINLYKIIFFYPSLSGYFQARLILKENMEKKNINRIRIVLAEQDRTNKWLAEQLDMSEVTVSRWVNNTQQPPIEIFLQIAAVLKVDIRDLFHSTMGKK
jgi:DNA-binding XRE family transcriptional regulator